MHAIKLAMVLCHEGAYSSAYVVDVWGVYGKSLALLWTVLRAQGCCTIHARSRQDDARYWLWCMRETTLAQYYIVDLIVDIGGNCSKLWKCLVVSRVLHKVSVRVLLKLRKWGPQCLERWHTHHPYWRHFWWGMPNESST